MSLPPGGDDRVAAFASHLSPTALADVAHSILRVLSRDLWGDG